MRAARQRPPAQRHHLVIGLVGVGPTLQEGDRVDLLLLGDRPGVVVVELVVVPGDDPGAEGVHGPQVRVGLVLRVADAVVLERSDLRPDMLADLAVAARALVDVVAEVDDQVEVVLGHVLVGGIQARLEVLARGEGEPQLIGLRARGGHGAGPGDRALGVAGAEAVPVRAVGVQAIHLDVDRVAELGRGDRRAAAHDLLHRVVGRELPAHLDVLGGHPAARLQRLGGQACPEDDPAGGRVARRDADGERVGRERRPASGPALGPPAGQGDGREGRRVGQEQSAADPALAAGGLVESVQIQHGFSPQGSGSRSVRSGRWMCPPDGPGYSSSCPRGYQAAGSISRKVSMKTS